MTQQQPHDNFINECKELFGEANAEFVSALIHYTRNAYGNWKEYKKLYVWDGNDLTHYQWIMEKTAPHFFLHVKFSMFTMLVLDICKLTDPPETWGKKNLTIRVLPNFITDQKRKNKIIELITYGDESVWDHFRLMRSKLVAHSDVNVTIKALQGQSPLEGISNDNMNEAMELIAEIFDVAYGDTNSVMNIRKLEPMMGSASLMQYLDQGLFAVHPTRNTCEDDVEFLDKYQQNVYELKQNLLVING